MTSRVIAHRHVAPYDEGMNVIAKDGTKLYVRDWGKGTPVLFVASAGMSADAWSQTIPAFLDAGHRCISFDRRGHGRSDEPDAASWDIDTLAEDIAAIAGRLELTNLAVVGHSLGGAEAIRYAARGGKSRVTKLVLLAPTAPFMQKTADSPDGIDRALIEALWATWRKDFPGWARAAARPFFDAHTSEAMLDWAVEIITRTPLHVHLALGRIVAETDLRGDLAGLTPSTLLLHGEKDVSVPVALGRAAAKLIPRCRYVEYPDAAHGLFLSHGEVVNREILSFLRD